MANRVQRIREGFLRIVERLNTLNNVKAEEINDLTDADTTGITPEDGWIVKYQNGVLKPCYRKVIRSSDLKIVQGNTGAMEPKFSVDLNIQRPGNYSFDVKSGASVNSTGSDLVVTLNLQPPTGPSESLATVSSNEMLRLEFKDAVGNDNDGRGTNQKDNIGNRLYANIPQIGIYTLTLDFSGSLANLDAALFDASCVVEEEFDIEINNA